METSLSQLLSNLDHPCGIPGAVLGSTARITAPSPLPWTPGSICLGLVWAWAMHITPPPGLKSQGQPCILLPSGWLNGSRRTCGVFRSPRLESPWLFSKEEFPKFFQNSDQDFRGGHSWKFDFPCFILAGQCIWSTSTEYTSQVPCDLVFQYCYYFLYMSHTSIFDFSEVKIWFALVWFFFLWGVLCFHSRNANEQKIKMFQERKCSGVPKSTH